MEAEEQLRADSRPRFSPKFCPFHKTLCSDQCALYVAKHEECSIALLAKEVARYLDAKALRDLLR